MSEAQASSVPHLALNHNQGSNRVVIGRTEYVLGRLNDAREGMFWTPTGENIGDPDFSFAEKVDQQSGSKYFVHVTTRTKLPNLIDWTTVAEADALTPCITVYSSETVTAYRFSEIEIPSGSAAADSSILPSASMANLAASAASGGGEGENQQNAEGGGEGEKKKPTPRAGQKTAVYSPSHMSPNPPLAHCWIPKLDRLKSKYFYVNVESGKKLWCLPVVTDLRSRVKAMFHRYAPEREPETEDICKEHEDKPQELIEKLVKQYGKEPDVVEAEVRERLTVIFARYDRAQLDDFEQLLADHTGKEEELIQSLLAKYNAPAEPPTYRQRILALMKQYCPERIATLEESMKVYNGRELNFIVALTRKFGPEPLCPCKADKSPEEIADYRRRAQRLYQKYKPERLNQLEQTMVNFEGLEELMIESLVKKYGSEPDPNEVLPEIDPRLNQVPESPRFGGSESAAAAAAAAAAAGQIPVPESGSDPMKVLPFAAGGSVPNQEQLGQLQMQQQQSAISMLTDMEERLRAAYSRLEEAHQRAEMLRNENLRLHEYSNKVMQDNDIITLEMRRQLSLAQQSADVIKQNCESEKEKLGRDQQAEIGLATQKLQEELLKGEQTKLDHQKTISELNAKLCQLDEEKGEATVQGQYLRQRCGTLEQEIEQANENIRDLKNRLKEKEEVNHRAVQTGGDDLELRSELKSRRVAAQRELESLGAECQHWRSLATRLETELRAAERKREESEKHAQEEQAKAVHALNQARDLNFALEDRVACLEAELLATPSSSASGSMVGEHELRQRIAELQRELTDAQATVRGQRQQVGDLRGLLAMHMSQSSPSSSPSTSAASRGVSALSASRGVSSPTAASQKPFSTSVHSPVSASATKRTTVTPNSAARR